jgi:HSP20 family protein
MTLAPFRGFWDIQSEVYRLFNDMVGDLLSRRREGVARERLWAPRLEAFARELRERRGELGLEGLAA